MEANSGATASEKFLTTLCEFTFLRFWSHPNLFRDQGRSSANGDGNEICDLLVVFGEQVIIFSDKHCNFCDSPDLKTGWKRWYKKAIIKSAGQVVGAENWITEHPDRIYIDRQCIKVLPVPIPVRPKFHRILTCRGIADASRRHLGGTGSLMVTNSLIDRCMENPFELGARDGNGRFYHIFDETVLADLLTALDTVSDFCSYLNKREELFRRQVVIHAAGEEEILGWYLMSNLPNSMEHGFDVNQGHDSIIFFDEGTWDVWISSQQRAAKLAADQISYCWDKLIEKFSQHILNRTQHFSSEHTIRELEVCVRWMARESRFRRRILAEFLIEAMANTLAGQIRKRYIPPTNSGDPYWVFLVFPQPSFAEYEDYREVRRTLLIDHCQVVRYLHSDALDVVGIAVEPIQDNISEDLIYLDGRFWTDELNQQAKNLHEERGIFKNSQQLLKKRREYPISDPRPKD